MNWVGLVAALLVTLLVQTTLARLGDLPLIELDLLLVLALLYGLLAPVQDARLAALLIGFAVDLTTEGAVGIYAFSFGLTGLLLTWMREVVNRQLWWGRLLITFLAALPGQLLIVLHLRFVQRAALGTVWQMLVSVVLVSATAALVTVLLTFLPPLAPRRHLARRGPWRRH